MGYNLAELTQEEKDKINVNLAASGLPFKERYNMPVVADAIARGATSSFTKLFSRKSDPFLSSTEASTILAYLLSRNKYRAQY